MNCRSSTDLIMGLRALLKAPLAESRIGALLQALPSADYCASPLLRYPVRSPSASFLSAGCTTSLRIQVHATYQSIALALLRRSSLRRPPRLILPVPPRRTRRYVRPATTLSHLTGKMGAQLS